VSGFAPDNSHAVVRMSSEDHSVGEKFCCSDSASPQSNPMLINANKSINEPESCTKEALLEFCTKEALLVEHLNENGIAIVGTHINSFGDTSTSWGTPFLPNIQTSKSNESVTRHANQMEVSSEEDKLSSWGTPWTIDSANKMSPCTGNFHGKYSLCPSLLHLNQVQWTSRENSWKNVNHFGTDM